MYHMPPECLKAAWGRHRQRSLTIRTWREFAAGAAPAGSVAVVGNAGCLAELAQGGMIDRHTVVIRLNNFQTVGHELQVGSRCDIFLTKFFTDIRIDRYELQHVKHVVASVPNAFAKHRRQHLHHRHAEHITTGLGQLSRREVCVPSATDFARERHLVATWLAPLLDRGVATCDPVLADDLRAAA